MNEETKAAPLSRDAEACLREWDRQFDGTGYGKELWHQRLPLRALIEKTLQDQAAKITEQSAKLRANARQITELEGMYDAKQHVVCEVVRLLGRGSSGLTDAEIGPELMGRLHASHCRHGQHLEKYCDQCRSPDLTMKPVGFEAWKNQSRGQNVLIVKDGLGEWQKNAYAGANDWDFVAESHPIPGREPLAGEELERCRVSFESRDRSRGPKDNLMENPQFKAAIDNAAKWGEESIRLRVELHTLQMNTATRIFGLQYDLRTAKRQTETMESAMSALAKNRDELADKLAKPSPEASELLAIWDARFSLDGKRHLKFFVEDEGSLFGWFISFREKISRFVPEKREVSVSVEEALKAFDAFMQFAERFLSPRRDGWIYAEAACRSKISAIVPPKPETPVKVKELVDAYGKMRRNMLSAGCDNAEKDFIAMLARLELLELPPGEWVEGITELVHAKAGGIERHTIFMKHHKVYVVTVAPKPARTKAEIAMLAMEHRKNPERTREWEEKMDSLDAEFLEAKE